MPITGLNPDKCAQRNRLAARRDNLTSAPMRFLKSAVNVGQGVTSALGTMPGSDEDALKRINALRGEDMEPLALEQVWIHYAEAANSSFIPDRYAFLSTKTLKNIGRDAQSGFAFMNSHRTGGLSHPSELPYGRTFAGRYEKNADGSERALIGFYMLRGQYPNGRNGPNTDDLHTGIDGGTIFDVSVGLYGGQAVCDVCGNDLNDWDACSHLPGTQYGMKDADKDAQRDRGVPDGLASYTLDNARCGETSAVYDGAVPGAGFNKALAFARQGKLNTHTQRQATKAYASLARKGDFGMDEEMEQAAESIVERVLRRIGLSNGNAPTQAGGVGTVPRRTQDHAAGAADTAPAQHPVLTAALAANIETAEEFAALQTRASEGDAYHAALDLELQQQAIRAFGQDDGPQRATEYAGASIAEKLAARNRWDKAANERFGQDAQTPTPRQTVPNALQQPKITALDATADNPQEAKQDKVNASLSRTGLGRRVLERRKQQANQ